MSEDKKNACCALPFSQMFIQSSGRVYPCSFLQRNFSVGDVKEQSLEEVWNSRDYQHFREQHLKGENLPCHENQKKFSCHLKASPYEKSATFKEQIEAPPFRLDFMVDSHCNIECIMCTNIYEERGGFEKPDFWELEERGVFKDVREIEAIGGEPFISKDFYKLVDSVLKVNPECYWKLTTNGHYRFNKKIRETLDRMNIINVGYSIDSLDDEIFSRIRKGGNLQTALGTLNQYIEFRDQLPPDQKFNLECNVVIQNLNAWEAPRFVEYAREKGIGLHLILLKHPPEHALISQPTDYQEKIFEEYCQELKRLRSRPLFELICQLFRALPKASQLKHADQLSTLANENKNTYSSEAKA